MDSRSLAHVYVWLGSLFAIIWRHVFSRIFHYIHPIILMPRLFFFSPLRVMQGREKIRQFKSTKGLGQTNLDLQFNGGKNLLKTIRFPRFFGFSFPASPQSEAAFSEPPKGSEAVTEAALPQRKEYESDAQNNFFFARDVVRKYLIWICRRKYHGSVEKNTCTFYTSTRIPCATN